MDVLSLIGIIMAFVAIIGGNFLEGGHLGALANRPAALIVLGGVIGLVVRRPRSDNLLAVAMIVLLCTYIGIGYSTVTLDI